MEQDQILAGIAAYSAAQNTIRAVIAEQGGQLHQDVFDREFDLHNRLFPATYMENHTFVLGNGTEPWAQWLHLMQLMMQAGLIKTDTLPDGKVAYRVDQPA